MFKALELEAYAIPVGGSNRLGTWGYIQKWEEWQLSGVLDQTKNIFVPVGSGGTAAGIIIGNYLTGSRHKIYLLQVADTVESLTEDIKSIIGQFTISGKPISIEEAMKKVTMFEAVGLGYAHRYVYHYTNSGYDFSTDEELQFIRKIGIKTGLLFDRVYSGKALRKSLEIIRSESLTDCLFLHTGGIHSISDSTMTSFLTES